MISSVHYELWLMVTASILMISIFLLMIYFDTLRQCMFVMSMLLFYFSPYLLYLVMWHER